MNLNGRRAGLWAVGLFCWVACGALEAADNAPATTTTAVAAESWLQTTLYLGGSRPDGSTVSEAEWDKFLAEVVTPRFPDGLTVLAGRGQWRDGAGKIVREPTRLLIILHPATPETETKLAEVCRLYKERFGQEAVLQATTPATVRFR